MGRARTGGWGLELPWRFTAEAAGFGETPRTLPKPQEELGNYSRGRNICDEQKTPAVSLRLALQAEEGPAPRAGPRRAGAAHGVCFNGLQVP